MLTERYWNPIARLHVSLKLRPRLAKRRSRTRRVEGTSITGLAVSLRLAPNGAVHRACECALLLVVRLRLPFIRITLMDSCQVTRHVLSLLLSP